MAFGRKATLVATVISAVAAVGSAVFAFQQAQSAKLALNIANRNNAAEALLVATVRVCQSVPDIFVLLDTQEPAKEYIYLDSDNVREALLTSAPEVKNLIKQTSLAISVLDIWLPPEESHDRFVMVREIQKVMSLASGLDAAVRPLEQLANLKVYCKFLALRLPYWLSGTGLQYAVVVPRFNVRQVQIDEWQASELRNREIGESPF